MPTLIIAVIVGLPFGIVGVAAGVLVANLLLLYPSWSIAGSLIEMTPRNVARSLAPQVVIATIVIGIGMLIRAALGLTGIMQVTILAATLTAAYWLTVLTCDWQLRSDLRDLVSGR